MIVVCKDDRKFLVQLIDTDLNIDSRLQAKKAVRVIRNQARQNGIDKVAQSKLTKSLAKRGQWIKNNICSYIAKIN